MAVREELMLAGFSRKQADRLAHNPFFIARNRKKRAGQIIDRLMLITMAYSIPIRMARKEVAAFPQFFSYKHLEVFRNAIEAYGQVHEDEIRKAIIKSPQFAGFNYAKKLRRAMDVYGDMDAVIKATLKYPPFAGHDHESAVRKAALIYGDAEAVKKAMLKFPPFVGLDHDRVARGMAEAYGDEEASKKAVLACPSIAGLDHERVVRELSRLGRMAGLDGEWVKARLLEEPILATYSSSRYLAMLDVGRELGKEGFRQGREMLETAMIYSAHSPYVPGTDRQRISHARIMGKRGEPPLMAKMRKRLMKRA